jgi:vitamin B12 transporter
VLALLALGGASAFAQGGPLPEITVSASQAPTEIGKVGAAVTVATGAEMRAKGITTVADALRFVPGVQVTGSGGPGTVTQVRIRGDEANHLMVVIDGIEVNSLGDGGFDFADLPVDDIERMEVLRGPQSGLYGANAHAGVVTIVTRSGRGLSRPVVDARVEGGARGTRNIGVNARGSAGPLYGSVTVSNTATDGYNISHFGSERDPSSAFTITAKSGIDFTPNFNVEGVVRHTNRSAASDPQDFNCVFDPVTSACPPANPATYGLVIDGNDRTTYESTIGRVGATLTLFDGAWTQMANVKGFEETVRGYSNGLLAFGGDGHRTNLDYKSIFRYGTDLFGGESHTLSVLVDNRREQYAAINEPTRYNKERTGLAGEYQLDLPTNTSLSAALRHDWNSDFADVFTYRFAASQRIPFSGTRLHASVGKGLTDPTPFELFGSMFNLPNPGLLPEQSVGWDAGVEQTFWDGRLVADVTYFSADFDRKIELTFDAARGGFVYVNGIGEAKRRGIEASATWQVFDWLTAKATYTYTDAKDSTGVEEVRRPPHSASFDATARFLDNRARATLGVVYNGERKDFYFGPAGTMLAPLPGVVVARAMLSYDVTPWATAYVRAENLFDAHYEEVFSYRAPGFAAYAGLRMRFGALD